MQMGKSRPVNPMTYAREFALQYLYQCEIEKIFYFDERRFERFATHFNMAPNLLEKAKGLVRGVLGDLPGLDETINTASRHWTVERMSAIDRNVLRLCLIELRAGATPPKVVINEGVNLAKLYGTEKSGGFVNGLLDRLAKEASVG